MASRATAHLNYIQYRPGEDRAEREPESGESKAREFEPDDPESAQSKPLHQHSAARQLRTPDGDQAASYKFRQAFIRENGRNDVVHKLILSPGDNRVDMDKYVQDVMSNLERAKGQQLRYGYVVHENTDHKHAHIIVLGRDKEHKLVRIKKLDHMRIRAYGDRHLEREHGIKRELDSDMEHFAKRHALNPEMSLAEGDKRFFDALDKADDKKSQRDVAIWDQIDEDWRKNLGLEPVEREHDYLGRQSMFHHKGRLSEMGLLYQNESDRDLWTNIQENCPDLKEVAQEKLAGLGEERQKFVEDLARTNNIENPNDLLEKISAELAKDSKLIQKVIEAGGLKSNRHDIDLSKVADEDKIKLPSGQMICKYDSVDYLREVDSVLRESGGSGYLPRDEYQRMWAWIGTKERHGEMVYGNPPLHERSRDNVADAPLDLGKLSKEMEGDGKLIDKLLKGELHADFMEFEEFDAHQAQVNRYFDGAKAGKEMERDDEWGWDEELDEKSTESHEPKEKEEHDQDSDDDDDDDQSDDLLREAIEGKVEPEKETETSLKAFDRDSESEEGEKQQASDDEKPRRDEDHKRGDR